jgi:hypothetical protein
VVVRGLGSTSRATISNGRALGMVSERINSGEMANLFSLGWEETLDRGIGGVILRTGLFSVPAPLLAQVSSGVFCCAHVEVRAGLAGRGREWK